MSRWTAGVAALLAGALFGCWLYGWRVIDPASFAWLLHGDAAQHYLGSVYFLSERWHWPPGLVAGFGDTPTSVVFTDSIPLLALPAKALGLAPGWQYFGAWMVASHALAGWFGWRLVRRLGATGAAAGVAALFFVVSPALLLRAYGHEALMGHFLVLAALERALAPWRWRGWVLLTAVAVLVHPYLAFMVALVGIGAAAAALLEREVAATRLLAQGAIAGVALLGVAWSAGYFVGSGQLSAAGHGMYSANLLTWLDPMDWAGFNRRFGREVAYAQEWSRLLPAQGQAGDGQYEGFAFLGAGGLALVLSACIAAMASSTRPRILDEAGVSRARGACVLAACIALALLAISARPSIGTAVIADVPLAPGVEDALGVFRASGRFIWPLTYLLMAWAIATVGSRPRGVWVLALCLALQVADLHGKFREFRARFRLGPVDVAQPVASPLWQSVLARCPNLALVSAAHPGAGWIGPALAAGLARARFHPAPTARFSPEAESRRVSEVTRLLQGQAWKPDTLYLLAAPLPPGIALRTVIDGLPAGMRYQHVDGLDVVFHERCGPG